MEVAQLSRQQLLNDLQLARSIVQQLDFLHRHVMYGAALPAGMPPASFQLPSLVQLWESKLAGIIPDRYADPKALAFVEGQVSSRQANSLRQAYEQWDRQKSNEDDLHNAELKAEMDKKPNKMEMASLLLTSFMIHPQYQDTVLQLLRKDREQIESKLQVRLPFRAQVGKDENA